MSFWIIACPHCRKAKVCRAGQKTATCAHCSRTLQLAGLRKHLATDSPEEAQRAAGLLNARLAGRLEAFLGESLPPAPPPRREPAGQRVRSLAIGLAAEGPFDAERFGAALARAGLDAAEAETWLERLVAQGVLYEPRRGRFARLP
jgi:hypothetical protein